MVRVDAFFCISYMDFEYGGISILLPLDILFKKGTRFCLLDCFKSTYYA